MAQNRSSAVMQQRVEPLDSLEDFPTPPWATRALVEHVVWPRLPVFDPPRYLARQMVWEPACNRGHMARPLQEYFRRVHASDIDDFSAEWDEQDRVVDFLAQGSESQHIKAQGLDWVITNAPFKLGLRFIQRAFEIEPREGVAVFTRTGFLESIGRYEALFCDRPPSVVAQFVERPILHKGVLRDPNKPYWDEATQQWRRPSTATAYCWLVWMMGRHDTEFMWIPPCRKDLERDDDYVSAN